MPSIIEPRPPATLDDLIARWPGDRPLALATWAGAGWSFIAQPRAMFRAARHPDHQSGACRCEWLDPATGVSLPPPVPLTHEPLADLERITAFHDAALEREGIPDDLFAGGWVGFISYDLGRLIEPRAQHAPRAAGADDWPLIEFHYCPDGLLVNHRTGIIQWTGDPARRPSLHSRARPTGPADSPSDPPAGFDFTANQNGYQEGVSRILEHIRAGDVYQVNLAHRLSGAFAGSTRSAFLTLHRAARPWYGVYIERAPDVQHPGHRSALLSMSPELFLDIEPQPDGTTQITTRPMKGTRPGGGDPDELRSNPKDRAELNMIVDLMRNDLGRICQPGSVRIADQRTIERHGSSGDESGPAGRGGILQATATITGTIRKGLGLGDVLRATFPPGSVTGAPKIRAMQIIDQLEPDARGPYCGAAGWIGRGRASFNVAIRTAMIAGRGQGARDHIDRGRLHYSVGAGIVADSTPHAEWQETLDKAGILTPLVNVQSPIPATMPARGSSGLI